MDEIICTLSIIYSLNPDHIWRNWSFYKAIRYYRIGTKIRQGLAVIDLAPMWGVVPGASVPGGAVPDMDINENTDPEKIQEYYSQEFNPDDFPEFKGAL